MVLIIYTVNASNLIFGVLRYGSGRKDGQSDDTKATLFRFRLAINKTLI